MVACLPCSTIVEGKPSLSQTVMPPKVHTSLAMPRPGSDYLIKNFVLPKKCATVVTQRRDD